MLAKRISICLIKIKANIGEKSRPPAEGINFLIGSRIFVDISSIIFSIGFGLFGATQLRITEPMIEKNRIRTEVLTVSIIEIKPRTLESY
jgi:hypothetical protein